ncbi:MAG: hypothetical protein ACM31E_02590 [Fibrobacterota bacterium]|nr:hypothetical protein [Chitinispirillaceae bacterium]
MTNVHWLVCLAVLTLFSCCDEELVGIDLFYKPPIYFAGVINGTYDSLTGNYWYQNECKLVGDTIKMFFYSKEFSEVNRIRDGDFIHIDIYPGSDSALGRSKVLFHMARYHGANASYNISPIDTLYGFDKIQFKVQSLERRHGGTLEIDNISVYAGGIPGTTGEILEIVKGTIKGTVK